MELENLELDELLIIAATERCLPTEKFKKSGEPSL